MVLTIPSTWKSFDDYLNSLASKYRSGAKKIARDVENAGITLEVVSDLEPVADRLLELYLNVQSHAAVRPVTVPAAIFRRWLARWVRTSDAPWRNTMTRSSVSSPAFVTARHLSDTSSASTMPRTRRLRCIFVCCRSALMMRSDSVARKSPSAERLLNRKPAWARNLNPWKSGSATASPFSTG